MVACILYRRRNESGLPNSLWCSAISADIVPPAAGGCRVERERERGGKRRPPRRAGWPGTAREGTEGTGTAGGRSLSPQFISVQKVESWIRFFVRLVREIPRIRLDNFHAATPAQQAMPPADGGGASASLSRSCRRERRCCRCSTRGVVNQICLFSVIFLPCWYMRTYIYSNLPR